MKLEEVKKLAAESQKLLREQERIAAVIESREADLKALIVQLKKEHGLTPKTLDAAIAELEATLRSIAESEGLAHLLAPETAAPGRPPTEVFAEEADAETDDAEDAAPAREELDVEESLDDLLADL